MWIAGSRTLYAIHFSLPSQYLQGSVDAHTQTISLYEQNTHTPQAKIEGKMASSLNHYNLGPTVYIISLISELSEYRIHRLDSWQIHPGR